MYFSLQCDEDRVGHPQGYYTEEGSYFDPYYDTGYGIASWIGEYLATVDWELVASWAIIAWGYFALSVVGPFFFPPFAVCIY
jgi:hypothetical protein